MSEVVDLVDALREVANIACGLSARIDQLEAARRDLLTPVANIPIQEGLADHDRT